MNSGYQNKYLDCYETTTIGSGSSKDEYGLLNHLNPSHRSKVMAVHSLSREQIRNYPFLLLMDERPPVNPFGAG